MSDFLTPIQDSVPHLTLGVLTFWMRTIWFYSPPWLKL